MTKSRVRLLLVAFVLGLAGGTVACSQEQLNPQPLPPSSPEPGGGDQKNGEPSSGTSSSSGMGGSSSSGSSSGGAVPDADAGTPSDASHDGGDAWAD
jgi:hypothetical protein